MPDPARPVPGSWDEEAYRNAGLFLASVTSPWLQVNAALGKIRDRLDPLLLAFMLTLARFANPDELSAGPEFLVDGLPDPRWANQLFRIVMTPKGGSPIVI